MASEQYRAVVSGREAVLLERVRVAMTTWERFRGLMLRRSLPGGEGLLFPDCRSVHTCFMRFPLDLVYLGGDNEVVKIVEGKRPWRLSGCRRAHSVLEMAAGRCGEVGLRVGDRLFFEGTGGDCE